MEPMSLVTATPADGLRLAVQLTRHVAEMIQPDAEVQQQLREEYAQDSEEILEATAAATAMFAIIATANDYWRP